MPRNFSWLEESKVAGSAKPETEFDLESVKQESIETIISLTGTPLNSQTVRSLGFEYLHSHISRASALDQPIEIIRFINEQNSSSK